MNTFILFCRSVSLLIQSVLPCALFGEKPSRFCLKGGTNAEMAPQVDYTIEVCIIYTVLYTCFC